jgi:hypothetical protein
LGGPQQSHVTDEFCHSELLRTNANAVLAGVSLLISKSLLQVFGALGSALFSWGSDSSVYGLIIAFRFFLGERPRLPTNNLAISTDLST